MKEIIIDLSRENPLIVYGPAYVTPLEGESIIYAKKLTNCVYIEKYKAYPVETPNSAKILVKYYSKKPEFKKIIGAWIWEKTVTNFLRNYSDTIILGKIDSGKTSLAVYIANMALKKNITPAIADYDPGQGDIGLPGFIGGGTVGKDILSLKEVDTPVYRFIGKTSPAGKEDRLLKEEKEIYKIIRKKSDFVIINYHGWIKGSRAFKIIYKLIDSLNLKKIFLIEDKELYFSLNLINKFYNNRYIIYLLKKPFTKRRSRFERRKIRENMYKDFFKNNDLTQFNIEITNRLTNLVEDKKSFLFDTDEIKKITEYLKSYLEINRVPECIAFNRNTLQLYYTMKNLDHVIINHINIKLDISIETIILPLENLNLIIGLRKNNSFYPGLLKKVDLKNKRITIVAPKKLFKDEKEIKEIRFGRIELDGEYQEKRILKKDLF